MRFSLLRSQLETDGRTESEIDQFVANVNKLVRPVIDTEDFCLAWAGPTATEAARCIIVELFGEYPWLSLTSRILEHPSLSPDEVFVFDIAHAEEEFTKRGLL